MGTGASKRPDKKKTPAPKDVAPDYTPGSKRSVRFKEGPSKEEPSNKTTNFYLDAPENGIPTDKDTDETTGDFLSDQSDSDEQDSPEPSNAQLRAHLTSTRRADIKPSQGEEQDDRNSTGPDPSREVMQLGKSGMSNSSRRPDGQTSTRSNKSSEPSQQDKPDMSKSSSRRSGGQHSPQSHDGKDSRKVKMSASSRESNGHSKSKYDEHTDPSSSTRSRGQSSPNSRDTIDSRNTDQSTTSRNSNESKQFRSGKHESSTNQPTNLRKNEMSASSRGSNEERPHQSVKNKGPIHPQQPGDSMWNSDEDRSPRSNKNMPPSSAEPPNTHGQPDRKGPASGPSSSPTKSPGDDSKQGFGFYNSKDPVAPTDFRDEKPAPPAPKASRDKQENSPPQMMEDKVQFIPSDPRLTKNLEFYQNRMTSRPRPGHKIEEMLKWRGDYRQLEINHRYIQWLFPIPESSDYNMEAQPLQGHEALAVRKDHQCRSRFLKAYEMMLDFYGMRLVSKATGEVTRCEKNWKKRFAHLNKSGHNYLRITRILKALACFGLAKYQKPWVTFFLNEVFVTKALGEIRHGAVIHWIDNMGDGEESTECLRLFQDLHANTKGIPQSKIRSPAEESDSESDDHDADANQPREHHVVDSQPPAAEGNTDELIQASFHQSAREKRREKQMQNVNFYKNELTSKPEPGSTVTEMLSWKGKHKNLVEQPYYIQWLFPIPETTGMNAEAQPLLPHEIQIIREDNYIKKRFLKAYEMMLDLYGMKLKSKINGTVGHAGKWKTRYEFLSSSINDHRKITRIIKALECFGYRRFQLPWVSFMINEIYANERLDIPLESVEVWIGIMADDEDKIACAESMEELLANAPDWNEREIRSRQRDPRAGKANGKPTKKEYYHNGKMNMSENDYPVQGRDARGRKPPEKKRPKTRVSDNVMMQHEMPGRVRHVLDTF